MDKAVERKFVNTFIQERLQERIIGELASAKKRQKAISRFCHTTDDIVKPQYILNKSNKLNSDTIMETIRKMTELTSCYVISFDKEIDGQGMTISQALQHCIGLGMPSIIIIGEQIAIIETEQETGASTKYLLHAI